MDVQAIQSAPGWGWPANPKADRPVAGDREATPARQDGATTDSRTSAADRTAHLDNRSIAEAEAVAEAEAEPAEPPPQRFRSEYRYDDGRGFIELLNDATERVLWTVPARAVIQLMTKETPEQPAGAKLNRVA